VHESYYQKEMPFMIFAYDEPQETLFDVKEIVTDDAAAKKVEDSIGRKISMDALKLVRLCYLAMMATENREIAILNFLRLGYKIGPKVTDMLTHDVVHTITKSAQGAQREGHFYKEFLRFSEYSKALVAVIELKNFVLPLIAPHFCDRFPSEQLMIYDKTNKHVFIYQDGQSSLIPLENLELPETGAEEEEYRALWRRFYNTIAIEGRYNPKLRINNMPKRYWAHMTEFN